MRLLDIGVDIRYPNLRTLLALSATVQLAKFLAWGPDPGRRFGHACRAQESRHVI